MDSAATTKDRRRRFPNWLKTILGIVVTGLALYFLASRLIGDWNSIPWNDLHFNYLTLAGSFALLLFAYIPLFGVTWIVLLGAMGEKLRLRDSIAILTVSQMGKYIPGKVWFTLGRIYLARRYGIDEAKTAVSTLVEAGFALLSALLLFGLSLLIIPAGNIPGQVYFAFLLVPLCLVVLYPPILNRLIRFLLRRLKRPVFDIHLSFARSAGLLGLYIAMWLAQGVGVYLLIISFYPLTIDRLPIVIGGYALAWILGFLSFITPAGLGIREGILTFALRFAMPEPIAIIVALLARVWITVTEGLVAIVMVFFLRKKKQETS